MPHDDKIAADIILTLNKNAINMSILTTKNWVLFDT
jgi:hypothetical protein